MYNNTKIIRLEKNYRSTKNILEVASEIISNNQNRVGKRPKAYLLNNKDLIKLINDRSKIYSKADYKINCDTLTKKEIDQIKQILQKNTNY